MLGPDGRPLAARGWYDTEVARRGRRHALCRHRARQPDRALRLSAKDGLLARGQPIAGAARHRKRCRNNKGLECLVVPPQGLPLAGTLIAISERGLDARGNILGFLIGGPSAGDVLRQAQRRFRRQRLRGDAARRSAGAGAAASRGRAASRMRIRRMPLAAIKPGALVDGPALIDADMGYQIDNMEGLSVHRARRRRARADADLGRQFLAAPAHAAAAVHAGRRVRRNRPRPDFGQLATKASARLGLLLRDLALEVARLGRQLVVLGLHQEGIEAAAMIDGLQRIGRNPQLAPSGRARRTSW